MEKHVKTLQIPKAEVRPLADHLQHRFSAVLLSPFNFSPVATNPHNHSYSPKIIENPMDLLADASRRIRMRSFYLESHRFGNA